MTELYFLPDWCYQSQVTCNNTCVGENWP